MDTDVSHENEKRLTDLEARVTALESAAGANEARTEGGAESGQPEETLFESVETGSES